MQSRICLSNGSDMDYVLSTFFDVRLLVALIGGARICSSSEYGEMMERWWYAADRLGEADKARWFLNVICRYKARASMDGIGGMIGSNSCNISHVACGLELRCLFLHRALE